MSEWAKNAAAFLSLAKTERRLSHLYRHMADETAEHGFVYEAGRMDAEARRLLKAARGHLRLARSNHELAQRTH